MNVLPWLWMFCPDCEAILMVGGGGDGNETSLVHQKCWDSALHLLCDSGQEVGRLNQKRNFRFFSLSLMTTTMLFPTWHHFGQPTLLSCLILTCRSVKRLFPFFSSVKDVTARTPLRAPWVFSGVLTFLTFDVTFSWPWPDLFSVNPWDFLKRQLFTPGDVCCPPCTALPNMCLQASPGLGLWLFHALYRVRRQTVFFVSYFVCVNLLQLSLVPVVLFLAVR